MRLVARAPAKVNLCLFVGPRRADGRHEVVTLLESVSVADEISIDAVDPFDIGAEARLAREIEGQVDTESAQLRHRVDEASEGRASGEREIDATAEIVARDRLWWDAGDAPR